MFLAPRGTRGSAKKVSYWRWLAGLALVVLLAACHTGTVTPPVNDDDDDNGGDTPPVTVEALTHAEFIEFVTEFEAEVTAAMDDLTPMVALRLALGAAGNASVPGAEVDGVHMLPRGEWEAAQDEWGSVYSWTRLGDLAGPGELQFTADVGVYSDEADDPEFHEVDYAIDWQAGGVATTEVELYGDTMEFPRAVSVRLDSERGTIADLSARGEPKSIAYECSDDWDTWSGDMLVFTNLFLNGTVGVASEVLLRAVDVGFEVNDAATTATSEGEISVEYATHTLGAAWEASLTTDSSLWGGYEDVWLCGEADLDGLNPELELNLALALNDTEIGLALRAATDDGETISVELAVEVDGAPAFTISGLIDATADEPLNDLVVKFSDEEQTFNEFMESMAPIFGEDL